MQNEKNDKTTQRQRLLPHLSCASSSSFNSEEIENLFPQISFKNYFAGMAPRPSYPGDEIIVMSPSYLAKLSVLVDQERDEILEAYFIFKITHKVG